MIHRHVQDFVLELEIAIPGIEEFWRLGDVTALRQDSDGRFYRANYERGVLLYALVAKYRPTVILEMGTGRGFGTLCMARALTDHEIPGHIVSIDTIGHDEKIRWPLRRPEQAAHVEQLSRQDVWDSFAAVEWTRKINLLKGFTGEIMRRYSGPKIDFAFVDAGHSFDEVKHDFFALTRILNEPFGVLFDDYCEKPKFGVKQFIDSHVAPKFEAQVIETDGVWDARESRDYGMVWIRNNQVGMLGRTYRGIDVSGVIWKTAITEWLRKLYLRVRRVRCERTL